MRPHESPSALHSPDFTMDRLKSFQLFWGTFVNQNDHAYGGLKRDSDIDSDEDTPKSTAFRSTLLVRALYLNAWLLAGVALLITFTRSFALFNCDCRDNVRIWAIPESGGYSFFSCCRRRVLCKNKPNTSRPF